MAEHYRKAHPGSMKRRKMSPLEREARTFTARSAARGPRDDYGNPIATPHFSPHYCPHCGLYHDKGK